MMAKKNKDDGGVMVGHVENIIDSLEAWLDARERDLEGERALKRLLALSLLIALQEGR